MYYAKDMNCIPISTYMQRLQHRNDFLLMQYICATNVAQKVTLDGYPLPITYISCTSAAEVSHVA